MHGLPTNSAKAKRHTTPFVVQRVSVCRRRMRALPLLRSVHRDHGPIAVLHFDAHLDTSDTYFGAPFTHGTPFRRAGEEGLLDPEHCLPGSCGRPPRRPGSVAISFRERTSSRLVVSMACLTSSSARRTSPSA